MTRWPLPMRFLLVIAVLIAAAPPRAGAARPKATRGISGQVLQVGGVTPIASVQVLIRGEGIGVSTNTDGRFVLPEVPSGAVEVVFLHPCYFPVHVALQATGDAVVAIGLPYDESSRQRAGCGGLGARRPEARGTTEQK